MKQVVGRRRVGRVVDLKVPIILHRNFMHNFTKFRMLFSAVLMNFSNSKFVENEKGSFVALQQMTSWWLYCNSEISINSGNFDGKFTIMKI